MSWLAYLVAIEVGLLLAYWLVLEVLDRRHRRQCVKAWRQTVQFHNVLAELEERRPSP